MNQLARTDKTFVEDKFVQRWLKVLTQVTTVEPIDLDDVLKKYDILSQPERGRVVFESLCSSPYRATTEEEELPAVGVRLFGAKVMSSEALARRVGELASLAVERGCEIIAISDADISGFERFGIRTERVGGQTEQERQECIQQIRDYWSIAVII